MGDHQVQIQIEGGRLVREGPRPDTKRQEAGGHVHGRIEW